MQTVAFFKEDDPGGKVFAIGILQPAEQSGFGAACIIRAPEVKNGDFVGLRTNHVINPLHIGFV